MTCHQLVSETAASSSQLWTNTLLKLRLKQQQQAVYPKRAHSSCLRRLLRMDLCDEGSDGSAHGYERMTVAVALAESTHHSSREQKNAGPECEGLS